MRGVTECLKWMLNNPMMELNRLDTLAKRRYNDEETQFERFNNDIKCWETVSCYFTLDSGDWQPCDPNPSVDFLTAYEDCLKNGTKYESNFDTVMFNFNDGVFVEVRTPLAEDYKKGTPLFSSVYLNTQWKKVK